MQSGLKKGELIRMAQDMVMREKEERMLDHHVMFPNSFAVAVYESWD